MFLSPFTKFSLVLFLLICQTLLFTPGRLLFPLTHHLLASRLHYSGREGRRKENGERERERERGRGRERGGGKGEERKRREGRVEKGKDEIERSEGGATEGRGWRKGRGRGKMERRESTEKRVKKEIKPGREEEKEEVRDGKDRRKTRKK